MARPVSMASSQALSHPPPASSPPRHPAAELFVTNLRLLDLDLRPDWPNISARTFSTKDAQQNQKHRVRCTEWALYRLFEIWDADETRDKLQPFFPPLEPLQSLNLRAALFRALNELKKNGVLGRESVLRKTMLDECKGDKLMEVLATFSTAVVKRLELAQTDRYAPVANTLATATIVNAVQQGSLLPLSIAYNASITSRLQKKEEKTARFHKFSELLHSKSLQLKERLDTCNELKQPDIDPAEEAKVKQILHDNWPGNSKWPQVVLYGDETSAGDWPLPRPFHEVWNAVAEGGQLSAEPDNVGLLENLERRVTEQSHRLRKWHDFHDQFLRDAPTAQRAPPTKTSFEFAQHREIRLGTNIPIDTACPWPQSAQGYQTVLSSLRIDLLNASKCRRERRGESKPAQEHAFFSPIKVQPVQARPRAPTGTGAVIVGQVGLRSLSLTSKHLLNKPSLRNSSPPVKVSSPDDVSSGEDFPTPEKTSTQMEFTRKPSLPTPIIRLDSPQPQSETSSSVQSPIQVSKGSSDEASQPSSSEDDDPAEQIIYSVLNSSPSPVKPTILTLAERTRMSMAQHSKPIVKHVQPLEPPPLPQEPPVPGIEIHNRRASLLERTRQSMSHVPAHDPRSKKHAHRNSHRQSLFPVNQFETPGKPRPAPEDMRRDATPTEKLFSEDAEYTSVFKSRPKIALSPVWSPDTPSSETGMGRLDEGVESDGDEGGGEGYLGSSPLANRRGINAG